MIKLSDVTVLGWVLSRLTSIHMKTQNINSKCWTGVVESNRWRRNKVTSTSANQTPDKKLNPVLMDEWQVLIRLTSNKQTESRSFCRHDNSLGLGETPKHTEKRDVLDAKTSRCTFRLQICLKTDWIWHQPCCCHCLLDSKTLGGKWREESFTPDRKKSFQQWT